MTTWLSELLTSKVKLAICPSPVGTVNVMARAHIMPAVGSLKIATPAASPFAPLIPDLQMFRATRLHYPDPEVFLETVT